MSRHTVTKQEMRRIIVTEQIASAAQRGENLAETLAFDYEHSTSAELAEMLTSAIRSAINDKLDELAASTLIMAESANPMSDWGWGWQDGVTDAAGGIANSKV